MIDTHAHLSMCTPSVEDLIVSAKKAGITHIVNVAVDIPSAKEAFELSRNFSMTHPTIGIHPLYDQAFSQLDEIETLLSETKGWCAIGETGLDYKYDTVDKDAQKIVFRSQLELARHYRLPVIIHNRGADDDVATILNEFRDVPAVLHCYSSSPEFANRINRDNVKFSFTGMITYSQKSKAIRTIRSLELSDVMIETDCPYLVPERYKGEENQPAFVTEVASKIAEIKGVSVDEVSSRTTQNAINFFNLPQ